MGPLDYHFHTPPPPSSPHGTSGSTPRSTTPVPLLDSPSFDPHLPSANPYAARSSSSVVPSQPAPPPQQPTRTHSGRAKGLPLRSQTMDDSFYGGPGEPSAVTRGLVPPQHAQGQWGAIGQGYASSSPKNSGFYNQGNHSSPSLAVVPGSPSSVPPLPSLPATSVKGSTFSPFDVPGLPRLPAIDDLNIGIENMRFEQRGAGSRGSSDLAPGGSSAASRRYSPNEIGSIGHGPDGAMEIRGRGDGTASVYSVDSGPGHSFGGSGAGPGGWPAGGAHVRTTSASSSRYGGAFDAPLYGKRDSLGGVEGYADVDAGRPPSGGSYLAYDDPYGGQAPTSNIPQPPQIMSSMQNSPYPGTGGDYFGGSGAPPSPVPPQHASSAFFPRSHMGGYPAGPANHLGFASSQPGPSFQQGPPQFQPQPGHGGTWGSDYQAMAAAQNPYYAAATGQLGLEPSQAPGLAPGPVAGPYGGGLHRGVSSVSSLGVPPQGSTNSLARSQSSLQIPGGTMRRKPTSASTSIAGSSSLSGPPITKASVDEYRQRIKADPDPEAQFNFAKYLIEAAKRLNSGANADDKAAKKYRDALVAESLKLIKRLATQGSGLGKPAYADAQFFLANCLGNGSLGLQIDHEKAYNLYVQASKQNHSAATYRTAVCNELGAGTRKDYARAVLFYRKASALGDTAGMYKLGMILLHGLLGQQRNPKEGLAWLKRAASQADEETPHALHELGTLYEKPPPLLSAATLGAKAAAAQLQQQQASGQGVPALVPYDPAQARELFTQAAQLGYPLSQFKLGSCYEFGTLTCPVDPRRSIAWYTRAAERGNPDAELALSGWYLTGSEGVLKQSDSEAYLWARRAANKGLPKAEYAVGYYSEVGIGVKADLEEAKRWYMRAAAQGNKRAMQRLTELKKLGADKRGAAGGKKRPTRKDAETECIVM
ncbi:chitin synthase activator [Rhodotorula toruloides]|uniref:Chitin synthase activator n=1 Tax=Rhodotorula toruloides TaxID=5286 RepID=A0A511KLW9_RHOTO|nr:chitin synthase activator [Rhodotorula toruloides]